MTEDSKTELIDKDLLPDEVKKLAEFTEVVSTELLRLNKTSLTIKRQGDVFHVELE